MASSNENFPGISLDLDKLRDLYGNESGCKVRIIIMEDGDKDPPEKGGKPPRKEHYLQIPPKR